VLIDESANDVIAADAYALTVFYSDGLLTTNEKDKENPACHFFDMLKRFPLEIQMIICNCLVDRVNRKKDYLIKLFDSERAFKKLSLSLWNSANAGNIENEMLIETNAKIAGRRIRK
jgi:hypothetical protein